MPVTVTSGSTVVGSIPLGQPVTLTVTFTSGGTPTDPTTVAVTIQLPDLTTASPSIVHDSTGAYHVVYTPTQAGRHVVRWVSTGTAAAAYEDVFDVDAAFNHAGIVSLAEVKAQLNKTDSNDDAELLAFIEAASDEVARIVGDVLPTTYTESHNGGAHQIILRHTPVLSITSLTENWGPQTYTLTNQPVGQSADPYGYSIDNPEAGVVTRRTSSSLPYPFYPGVGNVLVTYVAGRPTVPFGVQAAVKIIAAHLWETQHGVGGGRPNVYGEPVDVTPGMGYAIPNRAIELLRPYVTPPGIA